MSRVVMVVVILCLFLVPAVAGGNANFVLGQRSLDEGDWEPVEDQPVLGVTVDFEVEDWPVNIALGLYRSNDEKNIGPFELEGTITELSGGVLWHFGDDDRKIHPFVGVGLTLVQAEADLRIGSFSVDDDDTSAALYGQGGVFWRLGEKFNIGVDGRLVTGTDLRLGNNDVDADYLQVGLILGWGW